MKRTVLLLSILLWGLGSLAVADGIVVNGGFETGDFTGWTFVGGGCVGVGGNAVAATGCPTATLLDFDPGPHSGSFAAYLGNFGQVDTLSQVLSTTPGATYALEFFFASLSTNGETLPNLARVYWDGVLLGECLAPCGPFGYGPVTFSGLLATGTTTMLTFEFQNDPAAFIIDDVTVTGEVPEPGSLALVSSGLIALAGVVRRKLSL